ncbi:MAG TPA: hypothetical protein VL354_12220 [Spirochaetia bacterium]|nr:hypothetical protein [Spirochaetia bacterium]
MTKYFKPKTLKEAFEERYVRALRARVDISSFLIAEISAIEELIRREEKKATAEPAKADAEKQQSIADRVVEENRKRIAKYPDIAFHPDASEEVRRLLGALSVLLRDRWEKLGDALQRTMYSMSSSEMLSLDSKLHSLAATDKEEVPQLLVRLVSQLRKFPRNYPQIERHEKEYILEAAFLLNDLVIVLERVRQVHADVTAESKKTIEETLAYVSQIVNDFRVKDFKRKS